MKREKKRETKSMKTPTHAVAGNNVSLDLQ